MSILSDSEIAQRCILPEDALYFDQTQYAAQLEAQDRIGWPLAEHAAAALRGRIREACSRAYTAAERAAFRPMIHPYVAQSVRERFSERQKPVMTNPDGSVVMIRYPTDPVKLLSYGQSSYGYDVQLSKEVKIFSNANGEIVDPKNFSEGCLVDATVHSDDDGATHYVILPPNSYLLGRTVEYFIVPRDIFIIAMGKSTLARACAIVNVTPIEPGFEGNIVIEISNGSTLPVKIYLNEGVSQFVFLRGDLPCAVSYADRAGKYQGQTGIALPKV